MSILIRLLIWIVAFAVGALATMLLLNVLSAYVRGPVYSRRGVLLWYLSVICGGSFLSYVVLEQLDKLGPIRTSHKLNTPTKRVGALVMVAGMLVTLIGAMNLVPFSSYHVLEDAIGNMRHALERGPFWGLQNLGRNSHAPAALLLWLGLATVVGGLLTSFLYDQTIGKIVHWVRTGSFPVPPPPEVLPLPAKPPRPAQPPPASVIWIGDIFLLLLQNWLTALVGFGMGIVYLEARTVGYLVAPAGVALVLWIRAAIASGLAGDAGAGRALFLLLGIKLLIAYLFFGVGLLVVATGSIR